MEKKIRYLGAYKTNMESKDLTKKVEKNIRIIARLDIKGPNLVKGIHLEGLRVLGSPNDFARKYYKEGIDEIIYHDCVATLYGRNSLLEFVKKVSSDIFVPLTVGGGIRSLEDANKLLRSGADKVAINSALIDNPGLISQIIGEYGSQCLVLSVEAKLQKVDNWEVYTSNGRDRTGINVLDWIEKCTKLGVGEILLTSIDREGTGKGSDIELLKRVNSITKIPIIYSGGIGTPEHFINAVKNGGADGVAIADMIHYKKYNIRQIRKAAIKENINIREYV